jgi:hypothetical protein
MNKRVGSLKEFSFEPLSCERSLHVTVAVSGWLSDEQPGDDLALYCLYSQCCNVMCLPVFYVKMGA